MPPAVRLRDVVTLAGRFPLLAGVSLDVDPGEIVHLSGANGAGKTSVLRVIGGLVPIAGGTAEVLGHDLAQDRTAIRRHVGLVGHTTALYDGLSVEENVRFSLRAAGVAPTEADNAMRQLGLTGRLTSTRIENLSQGQRRRVGLAVLFARRPSVWLLDEPHAGLDADGRSTVDEVLAAAAGAGAAVVFASHELERAGDIATRSVTVSGGMVISRDPETTKVTEEGGRDVA